MRSNTRKKVSFLQEASLLDNSDQSFLPKYNKSLSNNKIASLVNISNKEYDDDDSEIRLKHDAVISEIKEENSEIENLNKSSDNSVDYIPSNKRLSFLMPSFLNEEKDEVEKMIEEKEMIKQKEYNRRETTKINRDKNRESNNKTMTNFNPFIVNNILEEENRTSDYGVYFKYLKFLDILVSITVCVNITLALIDNSIYIDQSNKYISQYLEDNNITNINITILAMVGDREISPTENSFRSTNIFVIISNEVFLILSYFVHLRILKSTNKISKYDNILSSGLYKQMLLEIILMAIFNPPNFNSVISGNVLGILFVYDYNSLITYLVILKSYVILRVYSYFSKWTSMSAQYICQRLKVEPGIKFAIKAELKKRPYTMLCIMMVIALGILGYGIRTFEYGVKDENMSYSKGDKIENDLVSLNNCFWLIIITMTTVGYGDMFPKTHYGRFIAVIACIIGMLLVSLIVVSLTIISQFSPEEKKAYSFIKKLHASDNAQCKAANVILKLLYVRRSFLSKTGKIQNSLAERFIFVLQLKKDLAVFKNDFRLANNYALPIDVMLKNLEIKLKEDMDFLNKNVNKLDSHSQALDTIYKEQMTLKEKLKKIMNMQDGIAKYLVCLNNQAYQNQLLNS